MGDNVRSSQLKYALYDNIGKKKKRNRGGDTVLKKLIYFLQKQITLSLGCVFKKLIVVLSCKNVDFVRVNT